MKFSLAIVASFLLAFAVRGGDSVGPTVRVCQGLLEGSEMVSTNGRPFFAFHGIPFAKPPVGELRFKPPLPAEPWDGTFNATNAPPLCPQMDSPSQVIGTEDCLTLSVFTPMLPNASYASLPVLVHIHHGGFATGTSSSANKPPQRFMNKDIVLVLISYRLNVLGFLSTGDPEAAGNFGLLDQVMALRWIQKNIHAFGGDPARVTISGQSAGGASVIYHLLSPMSKGLYRNAIAQSGSALCPWAFHKDPLAGALRFAQEVGCESTPTNTSLLVQCLRNKPVEQLVSANGRLRGDRLLSYLFGPVVENKINGMFLTEEPIKILKEGTFNRVPVISGVTADEMAFYFHRTADVYRSIDANFFDETFLPTLKNLTKLDSNLLNISYAVKQQYFDKIDLNNQTQVNRTVTDILSDSFFKAANDRTVRLLAAQWAPVYMYVFEYASEASRRFTRPGENEVNHEDDLYFLFNRTNLTGKDLEMSDTMVQMWTDFVSTSNPTPNQTPTRWCPTPPLADLHYLRIGQNSIGMEEANFTERMNFWNIQVPEIASCGVQSGDWR